MDKLQLKNSIKSFERRQIMFSLLALLFLVSLSLVFNFVYRSGQAAQVAGVLSRMVETHDFREVGLTLQDARLESFRVVRYISEKDGRSFTLPEVEELLPRQDWWWRLSTESIFLDLDMTSEVKDRVVFEFDRFYHVPHFLLIWVLLNLVSIPQTQWMKKRIVKQYEKDVLLQKELSRSEIAKQVRHNIRTPLSALMRLSSSIHFSTKEEHSLYQDVIGQIKHIISNLDDSMPLEKNRPHGLYEVIQSSIQEIRLSLPYGWRVELDMDDSLPSLIVPFIPHELKSVLSNLVTNAVEAFRESKLVKISLKDTGEVVEIEVKDFGCGIPTDVIDRVIENGFSYKKSAGTGIGLYHAERCVEEWGGKLRISSQVGLGTSVTIFLPIYERKSWYVPRLELGQNARIVVIDDRHTVHQLWKMKLDESGFQGKLDCHLKSSSEIWGSEKVGKDDIETHVFVDFDLGPDEEDGLKVLDSLPTSFKRYLVTGHHDDPDVRNRCESIGVYLIPKTELAFLPVAIV